MKGFLILLAIALAASPVFGCVGEIETYTDSGQKISIDASQEFVIALGSEHITGRVWQASYDTAMIEMVQKIWHWCSKDEQGVVGSSCVDYFQFKAVKRGETEITLVYRQPGEESTPNDVVKTFGVDIN